VQCPAGTFQNQTRAIECLVCALGSTSLPGSTTCYVETSTVEIGQALRLIPITSEPVNPKKGLMYYDDNIGKIRYWNGTTWIDL
jgi:hypothetical protein